MPVKVTYLTPLLQVFSMSRAPAFYRDKLGFEIVTDSGNGDDSSWVWLRLDGFDLMLNDQYEPGSVPASPPPERTKWHSDTIIYLGCDDPDEVFNHLKTVGITVDPPITTDYGMKQLYVHDPDGYSLCFQTEA